MGINLEPKKFSWKENLKPSIKYISRNLWFDLLIVQNNKKNPRGIVFTPETNFIEKCSQTKEMRYLMNIFDFKQLIDREGKKDYFFRSELGCFILDEYISGRKIFSHSFKINRKYSKKIWILLEDLFNEYSESIFKECPQLFVYLIVESFRFDLFIHCFFLENRNINRAELINLVTDSYLSNSTISEVFFPIFVKKFPVKKDLQLSWLINFLPTNFSLNVKDFMTREVQILVSLIKLMKLGISENLSFGPTLNIENIDLNGLFNKSVYFANRPFREIRSLLILSASREINTEIENMGSIFRDIKSHDLGRDKTIKLGFLPNDIKGDSLLKYAFIITESLSNVKQKKLQVFNYEIQNINKPSNWAKFTAGAILFISMKNYRLGFKVLEDFLSDNNLSDFIKGGLLFGLSINSKDYESLDRVVINKLENILQSQKSSPIKYGAVLGLSQYPQESWRSFESSEIYHLMKDSMYLEKISYQSLSIGLGLIFKGKPIKKLIKELILFLSETDNEMIVNSVATSLGLIFLNSKGRAVSVSDYLIKESGPGLRMCGINILAFGQRGSCNVQSLKKLIKEFCKESESNVKQTLVIAFGVIFQSHFDKIHWLFMELLNDSDPFVRYSCAFSILFCSIGNHECSETIAKLLIMLTFDRVDFVRQAGCITLGFVLKINSSHQLVERINNRLNEVLVEKTETNIAKFGALIAFSLNENQKSKNYFLQGNNLGSSLKIENLILGATYWYNINNILFWF